MEKSKRVRQSYLKDFHLFQKNDLIVSRIFVFSTNRGNNFHNTAEQVTPTQEAHGLVLTSRMFILKKRAKTACGVAGAVTFSIAAYQANTFREKYKHSEKLNPPTGPNSGLEKWVKKFHGFQEGLIEDKDEILEKTSAMLLDLKYKLSQSIEETVANLKLYNESSASPKYNKKKLIILGDSLVSGVGCDNDPGDFKSKSSPPLPKMLAKILSLAWQTDVEWCSYGFIGATAEDLRLLVLPKVKEDILVSMRIPKATKALTQSDSSPIAMATDDTEKVEIIFVVICGLNDWKLLLERFPFGPGPVRYKEELTSLIKDIETIGSDMDVKYTVYLPAIPLVCGRGDPSYLLGVSPLTYFVDFVSNVWDQQKKSVALDNQVEIPVCLQTTEQILLFHYKNV